MRKIFSAFVLGAVTVCVLLPATAHATSLKKMNVADLVNLSQLIVAGQVENMTDGFDANNLPYTEITVSVSDPIKGSVGTQHTFKQFGLMTPRDVGNGRTYLGVSPAGWPKFKQGEKVILFLHATTVLGFQSATGLLQGKFNVDKGLVFNEINNIGLFSDVSVDPAKLSDTEQKMLQSTQGKCSEETFVNFVKKAIQQRWFE